MCLEKKGTFKPCKVGYKVMVKTEDGIHSEFSCSNYDVLKQGVWLDEKDHRLEPNRVTPLHTVVSSAEYPLGWHVLHSYEEALGWGSNFTGSIIVKVKVKEPRCVGYSHRYQSCYGGKPLKTTIAKYIKIVEVLAH